MKNVHSWLAIGLLVLTMTGCPKQKDVEAPGSSLAQGPVFAVGDEIILHEDRACITEMHEDHLVLDYHNGITSHEEIFFASDDYAQIQPVTDRLMDCAR